jgi:hypothetical protein
MTLDFGGNMIDAIEQKLCELAGIKETDFKKDKSGDCTASKEGLTIRQYTGAFWEGIELTCSRKEYLLLDASYDGDAGVLEATIATLKVPEFRKIVQNLEETGAFYTRLKEKSQTKIHMSDDHPADSLLRVEIKPGEEEQAARIM